MKCPSCGSLNNRVTNSRLNNTESAIRRRRECQKCLWRFTTHERVEYTPIIIVKKDSRREDFSREKILLGLKKACEKRAISIDELEDIVDSIERDLKNSNDKEISSSFVGEKIMQYLHGLDDVAYVRFASVYREFKDVNDFIKEFDNLSSSSKINNDIKDDSEKTGE
ncbi:MAG: transcriptional regulator NrdR [Desulfobacteraceae bacterium 4572_130]|nr:MAG: transcriptional regulator NrdR [Desulfobacteraceae bacterium 4572_130]